MFVFFPHQVTLLKWHVIGGTTMLYLGLHVIHQDSEVGGVVTIAGSDIRARVSHSATFAGPAVRIPSPVAQKPRNQYDTNTHARTHTNTTQRYVMTYRY